jgi:hypothetical protein
MTQFDVSKFDCTATSGLCFSLHIWQHQQKQHGSNVAEARHLQHGVSSGSELVALAERRRQHGSGV